MKPFLIVALFLVFVSCRKENTSNSLSSHSMSAFINGVPWYSDSVLVFFGNSPNSITGFTGIAGKSEITLTLNTYKSFQTGTYNFRPAGVADVVFGSFNVQTDSLEGAVLEWTTLSESSSKSFSIERSTDGINFSVIGNVAAAGNSSTTQNYQFADDSPVRGNNFYRISAQGINGSIYYSFIQLFVVSRFIGASYNSISGDNGNIQVTSNDTLNHIATGNFSFDCVDYQNKPIQIRNGRFNIRY